MRIERAKCLDSTLEIVEKEAEQTLTYARSMRHKIASVLDWHLPEEETLDEVSKMRGKLAIYWNKVDREIKYISKHY